MKKYFDVLLGVLAAVGGFLDLGQLVFSLQIGSRFLYTEMWVLLLGTIAIILFMEMSGRIAAVAKKPTFTVIREDLGEKGGLITLVAATLVNVLTCAAEIGGAAIILKLLFSGAIPWLIVIVFVALFLSLLLLPFEAIERGFGLLGLCMVVFAVAVFPMHPHWGEVLKGFIPSVSHSSPSDIFYYWFTVVALYSAVILPYEVYLYSSGAMEDGWGTKDLTVNRITSIFGSIFGALLTAALIIIGALVFMPRGLSPELPGEAALGPALVFGSKAVVIGILGMLFAIGSAALETALAGAYSIAQFFGWKWSQSQPLKKGS